MDGNTTPSPELPLPVTQSQEKVSGGQPEKAAPTQEKQAFSREGVSQQAPAMPVGPLPTSAPVDPTSTAVADDQQLMSSLGVADDTDVIEKEWVSKAKDIVNRTRNDPRQQTKELSHFKAEYIKTRFQKDIKLAEDTE